MDIERLSVLEQASLLSGASEWDSRGVERAGIPSFVMSDGPHGVRRQLGSGDHLGLGSSKPATCFPTAGTVANSWNPELAEAMGRALGEEARDLGVNVLLGPGMNIKRNPLCGRNFEYYSEDPQLSGRMAAGLIDGIQSNDIAACPKHFAVNSQELHRQSSNSVVDERTMRELYLTAFEIAVRQAHPWAMMTSYNRINGVYAHENAHLLQDILRDEWGFDGMVVSDWGGSNSAVAAVKAGGSLEMPSPGLTSLRELMGAVAAGTLAPADIAVRAREVVGIAARTRHENVKRDGALTAGQVEGHHRVARSVAEESMVLLRNRQGTLPLPRGSRIAVIGDLARSTRFQGAGSSSVNATRSEHLLDELSHSEQLDVEGFAAGYERHGAANRAMLEDAVALAGKQQVDAVVAVVGLDERSETEGLDRSTMALPKAQDDLIAALRGATQKPLVVVLVSGSPVQTPWADDVDALMYMGLSGQAGSSAAVRLLEGSVNPSGHLAETWPVSYGDCPSASWYPATGRDAIYREGPFVGYRYYETAGVDVRFPFGFGLSYSTFVYSGLSVDNEGVTFLVTNTSDVPGYAVPQLYLRGPQGGVLRPARELKGFAKVHVGAHERVSVRIAFDRYTFRHFDTSSGTWHNESGTWSVMIGTDAHTMVLRADTRHIGDSEPCAADPALGAYRTGHVHDVTDAEMVTLFGHPVIAPGKQTTFDANDPISSWRDSRSFLARTVARSLARRERSMRLKHGAPDLNTLFLLNMPPRAMCKMTGGMVDAAMVDAIVAIANGRTWRGLAAVIGRYFHNQSANHHIDKELDHVLHTA